MFQSCYLKFREGGYNIYQQRNLCLDQLSRISRIHFSMPLLYQSFAITRRCSGYYILYFNLLSEVANVSLLLPKSALLRELIGLYNIIVNAFHLELQLAENNHRKIQNRDYDISTYPGPQKKIKVFIKLCIHRCVSVK